MMRGMAEGMDRKELQEKVLREDPQGVGAECIWGGRERSLA